MNFSRIRFEYFEKSHNLNNLNGSARVGWFYATGRSPEKNEKLGLQLIEMGIQNQIPDAYFLFGFFFFFFQISK